MKPWQFILLGLVLLATSACCSDPYAGVRERQLRMQEDEIYRLREMVRDLREDSQCADRPTRASKPGDADRDSETSRRKGSGGGNGGPGLDIEMPGQPSHEIPDTLKGLPRSTSPNGSDAPESLPTPLKSTGPRLDGPSLEPVTEEGPRRPRNAVLASQAARAEPFTPSGNSRQVAAIALRRELTGGINSGDRSGDQGLLVVVEPRDRAGRTVDAPAEMSIVAIDPAKRDEEGMATTVARWDFTAAETAAMFRRNGAGRAIYLTMTWPGEPPTHGKLRVFVRYVTADGRKLEANQAIEVALAGAATARWDPADLPRHPQRQVDRDEPPEAEPPSEMVAARVPGPSPSLPRPPESAIPPRPVWSPDRQ